MVTMDELKRAVDARYQAMNPPSWPNPHPEGASRVEQEYGRVTDFRSYEVPPLRTRAWVDTLVGLGLATVEDAAPVPDPYLHGKTRRRTIVRSVRPGTLPLWVTTTAVGATMLAVADPQIEIASEPDCGCDACDFGSDSFVQAIDAAMSAVVTGAVHVTQDRQQRQIETPERWERSDHQLETPLIGQWHGAPWVD